MEGLFIFLEYSSGVKYTISSMRWIHLPFGNFRVLFSFKKANLGADINRKIKKIQICISSLSNRHKKLDQSVAVSSSGVPSEFGFLQLTT